MWNASDYALVCPSGAEHLPAVAARAYALTWRYDFAAPGFCLIDLGPDVAPYALRQLMIGLRRELSRVHLERRRPPTFAVRVLSRFDQQASTGFHLDGAAPAALLMLGYEPSSVHSRVFLADYTRLAHDLGVSAQAFLNEPLPVLPPGEHLLARYVTELPQPERGHSRLLLMNNSSLPFSGDSEHPLGVLHRAEVSAPSTSDRRIVNSIMLVLGKPDLNCGEREEQFVRSEAYNPYTG